MFPRGKKKGGRGKSSLSISLRLTGMAEIDGKCCCVVLPPFLPAMPPPHPHPNFRIASTLLALPAKKGKFGERGGRKEGKEEVAVLCEL